jgi:hypothetical protein
MDFEKIQNVITMLQSPDKENHIVGLTVMEQQIHKDNLVPLLMAYKFGLPKEEDWILTAPMAFKYLSSKVAISQGIRVTFNDVFECIIETKAPASDMKLFMQMFSKYLTNQCKNLGYKFIDEIQMNIIIKKEEHVNTD